MECDQFECSFQDCHLTFSTQSLLNIHKKKHEMVLSLHRTTVNTVDETPTPVRFMRNCEEIGLFQDLQNVNPFEETFRKAAEGIKKGTFKPNLTPSLSRTAGDELHTPHVFPEIPSEVAPSAPESAKLNSSNQEAVVITEADTSDETAEPVQTLPPNSEETSAEPLSDHVEVLVRMPDGTCLQLMAKQFKNTTPIDEPLVMKPVPEVKRNNTVALHPQSSPQPAPKAVSGPPKQALVKQKLKAFLNGCSKTKTLDSRNLIESQKGNVIGQGKQVQERTTASKPREKEPVEEVDQEKRKQILERNRKAASRSREKRKQWVTDLVKRAEVTNSVNSQLVREITALRAEVLRLQNLLALHDSCSVTLAAAAVASAEPHSIELTEVSCSPRISRREGLTLDIDRASTNTLMDLDSPVVRKDAVLASVAAPPTPDEQRLVAFPELERDEVGSEVNADDRISSATTVIQFNPNALKQHVFS